MASGFAKPDAKEFELFAKEDDRCAGISSIPFFNYAFRIVEFRIKVSMHSDETWSYEQDTVMKIKDQAQIFHHVDNNTLHKIGEATPTILLRDDVVNRNLFSVDAIRAIIDGPYLIQSDNLEIPIDYFVPSSTCLSVNAANPRDWVSFITLRRIFNASVGIVM